MIITLEIPEPDYSLTIYDVPISILIEISDGYHHLSPVKDRLEKIIPFSHIIKNLDNIDEVVDFLTNPIIKPLTYEVFYALRRYLNIHIDWDHKLFDLLKLSTLNTQSFIFPDYIGKVLIHSMVKNYAYQDNYSHSFEEYYQLVINYHNVVHQSCWEYSEYEPYGKDRFDITPDQLKKDMILLTMDLIINNKPTPRQHFLTLGIVYLFDRTSYTQPSINNVYLQLNKMMVIVEHYGDIYYYQPGEYIENIFDDPTYRNIKKLLTIKWT